MLAAASVVGSMIDSILNVLPVTWAIAACKSEAELPPSKEALAGTRPARSLPQVQVQVQVQELLILATGWEPLALRQPAGSSARE